VKLPAFPLVTCSPCRGASQGSRRPRRRSGVPISDPLRPTLVRLTTGRRAEERLVPVPAVGWSPLPPCGTRLVGTRWSPSSGSRAGPPRPTAHRPDLDGRAWRSTGRHGAYPRRSPGASTTRTCSWEPSGSSGRTTSPISPTTGSRRWKGWKRSCALVPRSPMSAAGTARRR
jgi:hypothetical protein